MLASILLALVGGAALVLGSAGRDLLVTTDAAMASQTSARAALAKLRGELQEGSRGALGELLTCSTGADGSWTISARFDLRDPGLAEGALDSQAEPDQRVTYAFDPSTGSLTRQVERPPGTALGPPTTLVAGLSAARIRQCESSSGLVDVEITARTNTLRGRLDHTLRAQIWLRNP
jgi:hypothetical protein